MTNRSAITATALVAAIIVVLAMVAGAVAVWRIDHWGDGGSGLPAAFEYDLERYQKTDPAVIGYKQTAAFDVPLKRPRGIATGLDDAIYVAGDQAILVFAPNGTRRQEIGLHGEPGCVAVGGAEHVFPGHIYVGLTDHVEVFDFKGKTFGVWESLGPKALITSIAPGEHDVFVANAGGRIVVRYDGAGKRLGTIGARDEARNVPGFVIPSPYFDLAVAPDGLLRVVNPAGHRIEAYTSDGSFELAWGKYSVGLDGFCGCCNPANIAVLPDGRIVTAEKGIPRVKLHTAEGEFVKVVAAPEQLTPHPGSAEETRPEHRLKVIDVAADSRGRVLVLDPNTRQVRIFESTKPAAK